MALQLFPLWEALHDKTDTLSRLESRVVSQQGHHCGGTARLRMNAWSSIVLYLLVMFCFPVPVMSMWTF
jgi:hypothetical protein